jgi:hypothetical protein
VRQYLPELIDLVLSGQVHPGQVFDLTLPSARSPRATAPWTSGEPSRRCSYPETRPGAMISAATSGAIHLVQTADSYVLQEALAS